MDGRALDCNSHGLPPGRAGGALNWPRGECASCPSGLKPLRKSADLLGNGQRGFCAIAAPPHGPSAYVSRREQVMKRYASALAAILFTVSLSSVASASGPLSFGLGGGITIP